MGKLIVVCEGGIHTVEYLHGNGVYPDALVLAPDKIPEMLPYMGEDDDVLVIVKGLTDFTMSDIYAMMSKLRENAKKVQSITLMSNIEIGVVPYPYYIYEGDLFYGNVRVMKDRRLYTLDGRKVKRDEKESDAKENEIMVGMKEKYGDSRRNLKIYGKLKREKPVIERCVEADRVVCVDLYK